MNGFRARRRLTPVGGVVMVISLCQAVATAQVGPAKVSVTEIV